MIALALWCALATTSGTLTGVVRDEANAPVAGAWVTAIDEAGPTHERKTVVTDASGAYRIDGLDAAAMRVRVRVYGYADRWVRGVHPEGTLDVRFDTGDKLGAAETAAQYPSSYWLSLMKPPAGKDADWTTNVVYNCAHCHQIGTRPMRFPRTRDQWSASLRLSARTELTIDKLGRDSVLDLFSAWSDRLASGALPSEAPPRPSGAAAKAVITEWNVGGPLTWFREVAAGYAADSSKGAAPPKGASGHWVYTADVAWGVLVGVDVDTGARREWPIPVHGSRVWPYGSWNLFHMTSAPITLQVDPEGKIVIAELVSDDSPTGVLNTGVASALKLLPPTTDDGRAWGGNHQLLVFDPRNESWDPILTPCDTHGITIAGDGTIWQTRQEDQICSYDPVKKKSTAYAWPSSWGKGIVGGNDVGADGKVWFFFTFTFGPQDALDVFDAKTGSFARFPIPAPGRLPRHVCVDSQNRPYLLLQSGHLGRFDPKTQRWKLWPLPDSRVGGAGFAVNLGFSCVVDRSGATGTKDAVYISGNLSDSIIAFDPAREQFTNYRMPGEFYTKDLEIHDGAVWAVIAENPEKYLEPDPVAGVALPRLVRLDPQGRR